MRVHINTVYMNMVHMNIVYINQITYEPYSYEHSTYDPLASASCITLQGLFAEKYITNNLKQNLTPKSYLFKIYFIVSTKKQLSVGLEVGSTAKYCSS